MVLDRLKVLEGLKIIDEEVVDFQTVLSADVVLEADVLFALLVTPIDEVLSAFAVLPDKTVNGVVIAFMKLLLLSDGPKFCVVFKMVLG